MATIYPVIMAGGAGTRLWPLSRKSYPKQYHALAGDQSLIAETVLRVGNVPGADMAAPSVICAEAHLDRINALKTGTGVDFRAIMLEPVGRNTAPVAVAAALMVAESDPDGLILLLPSDHHIADHKGFCEAVVTASAAATKGYLTTFGIAPDRPETGYGYIREGAPLEEGVATVSAFVEKPDRETAEAYIAAGDYTWNAGIFLYPAARLLEEAEAHATEILSATKAAFDAARREGHMIYLPKDEFSAVPADSIDYAIMEKTAHAAVVGPVSMGWNDIGSWFAVRALSEEGRVAEGTGSVIAIDCEGSYLRSSGPALGAIGLQDIVVVATEDAVLVVDAHRTQDVKNVIEQLKSNGREDLL